MALYFLGVSGHYGAGKDTFGTALVTALQDRGVPAKRFAFADALKQLAKQYFKWDGVKSSDSRSPQYIDSDYCYVDLIGGRTLLQGLGLLFREQVQQNFWVQKLKEEAEAWMRSLETALPLTNRPCYAVVTDVRFFNETQLLHHLFFITREAHTGDAHISEQEMETDLFQKQVGTVVENNGTLEQLIEQAKRHAAIWEALPC